MKYWTSMKECPKIKKGMSLKITSKRSYWSIHNEKPLFSRGRKELKFIPRAG
jgi:hypothetical protein